MKLTNFFSLFDWYADEIYWKEKSLEFECKFNDSKALRHIMKLEIDELRPIVERLKKRIESNEPITKTILQSPMNLQFILKEELQKILKMS